MKLKIIFTAFFVLVAKSYSQEKAFYTGVGTRPNQAKGDAVVNCILQTGKYCVAETELTPLDNPHFYGPTVEAKAIVQRPEKQVVIKAILLKDYTKFELSMKYPSLGKSN